MKKRIFSLLILAVLCVAVALPVSAVYPRLVDEADLLTDTQYNDLQSLLEEVSNRQRLDVVIVTVNSLGGKSPMQFADDYYDSHNYGFGADRDGVLLLVSMEDRDWWISTSGYGITAFTDAGIDYLADRFLSDLSDGFYADAFETFVHGCDEFITAAKNGQPIDIHSLPKEDFRIGKTLLTGLVIGLVVALVVTGIWKGQLKTVRMQTAAADYIKKDSMKITQSNDLYLYRHVTKTKRETNSGGSSTHRSSSGRSHGGGGGKF